MADRGGNSQSRFPLPDISSGCLEGLLVGGSLRFFRLAAVVDTESSSVFSTESVLANCSAKINPMHIAVAITVATNAHLLRLFIFTALS